MQTNQCIILHKCLVPPGVCSITIPLGKDYMLIAGPQDNLVQSVTADGKQVIILGPIMQLDSSRQGIAKEIRKVRADNIDSVLSTFSGEYAVICNNTIRQDFVGLFGLCVFDHMGRKAVGNSPQAFKHLRWDLGYKDLSQKVG